MPAPPEPGKAETPPPAGPPQVPGAAALATAEQLIRETFQAEYARGAAPDKAALAKALLNEVPENLADAPALYVLLREARDLAAAAGDVGSAVDAARGLRDAFKMEPAAAKEMERSAMTSAARAMTTAPATVATPAAARRATELLLGAAERDLQAGEYAAAAQAEVAARRANKPGPAQPPPRLAAHAPGGRGALRTSAELRQPNSRRRTSAAAGWLGARRSASLTVPSARASSSSFQIGSLPEQAFHPPPVLRTIH